MNERLNRTSICSVVFLDIINYSKKPVAEQIECKERFNALINEAIRDVAQNDRIILDTGDGAALALLGAPEEALFISLTIRDGVFKIDQQHGLDLHVRTGINLGPVRVVKDINGQLNIIGDGINVAQQVMNFAEPDQILVSRSYYEVTSRLTNEITRMFSYSGIKRDKHIREHEVYAVRSAGESVEDVPLSTGTPGYAEIPLVPASGSLIKHKRELALGVFALVGIVTVILLFYKSVTEQVSTPVAIEPEKTVTRHSVSQNQESQHKDDSSGKSMWENFTQNLKQGNKAEPCTQAEKALNQCK